MALKGLEAHMEVVIKILSFFFIENSGSMFLVFLQFDLQNFGLERSRRLKGTFPPVFAKIAWCGNEL